MQANQTFSTLSFLGMRCLAGGESSQEDLEVQRGGRGAAVRGGGPQHRRTRLPPFHGFHMENNCTAAVSLHAVSWPGTIPAVGWMYWWGLFALTTGNLPHCQVRSLSPIPFAAERGGCCRTRVLLFERWLSVLLLEMYSCPPRGQYTFIIPGKSVNISLAPQKVKQQQKPS